MGVVIYFLSYIAKKITLWHFYLITHQIPPTARHYEPNKPLNFQKNILHMSLR